MDKSSIASCCASTEVYLQDETDVQNVQAADEKPLPFGTIVDRWKLIATLGRYACIVVFCTCGKPLCHTGDLRLYYDVQRWLLLLLFGRGSMVQKTATCRAKDWWHFGLQR